jgi:uncharacterized membrane protein
MHSVERNRPTTERILMAQVIETVDVNVPVDKAYNQWTQFESFPHFLSYVESIQQQDDTHNHWKVRIGGVEREFDAVITEQHPDERVAWRSVDGTQHAGVVTFHKLSDTSSRVAVQIDWNPQGAVEKVGEALGLDERSVKQDLLQFKEFIESRPVETGAWREDVPRS